MPVVFEANEGQAPTPVRYLARSGESTLELTNNSAVLASAEGYLGMFLIGANPHAEPEATSKLPGLVNYFIGRDPKDWHTGISTYQDVVYPGVYPGIDLSWHGGGAAGTALEYDFAVAPGADPSAIAINMAGATSLSIDAAGNLVIVTPEGTLHQAAPLLYQERDGRQVPVSGGYVLKSGSIVQFRVGSYDHAKPLTIDPLLYSTYIGTDSGASASGVAVDSSGDAYLTGQLNLGGSGGTTGTATFPTTPGAFETVPQGLAGSSAAFVTKLDPTKAGAASLMYSTFLTGGLDVLASNPNPSQGASAIAVDANGNAYIVGGTNSASWPVTPGAFRSAVSPDGGDAFITELNASGSGLLYSTYFGGGSATGGPGGSFAGTGATGLALDSQGDAYVTGETTNATSFPTSTATTPMPLQGTFLGSFLDGFVAKFNPAASGAASLVYSTYLSGSAGSDEGLGITVDSSGDAYVGGETASTDFPGTASSPIQSANAGGAQDGFVTELNPTGSAQLWATYLGGSGSDAVNAVALDGAGDLYVTGNESSTNFPVTAGAFQSARAGNFDAFLTKISSSGRSLVYSTLIGGSRADHGNSVAVDGIGDAYVAGETASQNFPSLHLIESTWSSGTGAAFVTKVNSSGTGLLYSTYLGGNEANFEDDAVGVAIGAPGIAYVAATAGIGFNTTSNAFDSTYPGGANTSAEPVFSVISDPGGSTDLGVTATSSPDSVTAGNPVTYTVTVTDNPASPGPASGIGVTDTMPSGVSFGSVTSTAGGTCTQASGVVGCAIPSLFPGDSATISIVGTPTTPGTVTDTVAATENETDTNPADNTATATTTVSAPLAADLSATLSSSPTATVVGLPLSYSIGVSNAGPSAAPGTTLTDNLPTGVSYTSVSASQGSCTGGAAISCALGNLAAGAGATVTVGVVPTTTGTIVDSASVTSTLTDPNPANNSASVTTVVTSPTADLAVSATVTPNPAFASSTLSYRIVTTNAGPSAASSVTLTDALGAGETFVSASPTQGSCVAASATVSCSFGSLAAGASVSTAISVIAPPAPATVTATASVTATELDANTANNTVAVSSQVLSATVPPSSATCGNTGVLAASATMCTYSVSGTDVFNPPAGVSQATFSLVGGASGSTSNLTTTSPGQPGGTTTGTVSFAGTPVQIDVAGAGGSVAPTSTMGGMNNGVSGGTGGSPGFGGSNAGLLTSNGDAPGGAGGPHPQNGGNGSGGGGASDVRIDPAGCATYSCPLADRILVAGGGGGNGGNGGNGGAQGGAGGAGGGITGANASSSIAGGSPGAPGQGATQSAGGIGGTNVSAGAPPSENGVTATSSAGGAGGSGPNTGGGAAGGGGGGYWGGGGGAAGGGSFGGGGGAGGGGGGGSGFVTTTAINASTSQGTGPILNGGTGMVVVSWAAQPASADLAATLSAPATATAANPVTETATVANNGPDAATGVSLTDTLPAGANFVSASSTAGSCTNASGTLSCAIGPLAVSATATVSVVMTPTAPGALVSTVSVSGNEADPNAANNTATATTTVSAPAPGSIVGTVTDATTHAPLTNICEYLYTTAGTRTADPGVCTTTGGGYILPVAAPGSYRLAFVDPTGHYNTQWYNSAATEATASTVTVAAGEATTGINAAMAAPALITGTVTNTTTGSPLPNICVYLYTTGGTRTADTGTCTTTDGSYAMAVANPGSYDVAFADPSGHYLTQWFTDAPTTATATPVTVSAGATTANINAAMAAPALITGTVTDTATGSPLPNICVYLYTTTGTRTADTGTCTTTNGSYAMAVANPGSYDVAFADPSGHFLTQWFNDVPTTATATPVTVSAGATTANINAAMAAPALITGTVTDAGTGSPLPNICVYLYTTTGTRTSDVGTCTGPDGSYAMAVANPGSYHVAFFDPSGAHLTGWYNNVLTEASATPVTVTTGAPTPNVNESTQP